MILYSLNVTYGASSVRETRLDGLQRSKKSISKYNEIAQQFQNTLFYPTCMDSHLLHTHFILLLLENYTMERVICAQNTIATNNNILVILWSEYIDLCKSFGYA